MLPNLQQFLSLLVCGIQLWGAALTYWLPLRHSPHFWQRALLCLIPSIPLSTFLLWADYTSFSLFLRAGAYILLLYVDDFRFPQLHPVGLVRRQLLRHLGNFECPDDI
ncbi:MAG: hypothetical protein ACLVFC_02105 [Subdoligranulum sp.]